MSKNPVDDIRRKDKFGRPPVGWIVESPDSKVKPYLTFKENVAEKRERAGDNVTPYHSAWAPEEGEEL